MTQQQQTQRTVLFERHINLGAKMVPFGGWEMPVQYPDGILQEHLATRRSAGLFDVSHMGRFVLKGREALPFLQHVLTNNAEALEPGQSQYTLIPDTQGGAVDDAYLYRFFEDSYLLVVNAANRQKDWDHLQSLKTRFKEVVLEDHTDAIAMISLQGPLSKAVLFELDRDIVLPEPQRNALSVTRIKQTTVWLARTGYTGEPLCFELFVPSGEAVAIWDQLIEKGAAPIGLGARDTLRLEAGLPLYGHELGELQDPAGGSIPIFSIALARFAVSFSPLKGDFIGKSALLRQFRALKAVMDEHDDETDALPRRVRSIALLDKGIARAGAPVFFKDRPAGYVTSGTMVPYWRFEGSGVDTVITDETDRRAIGLAMIDSRIPDGASITVEVRGKQLKAGVMPYLMRSEAPPYARAITWHEYRQTGRSFKPSAPGTDQALSWIRKTIDNTTWRQQACINLIPSEQTPSPLVRLLSVMDPAGRYAEHKNVKALGDADVFYYQGTDFIAAVEQALVEQMQQFMGCRFVETRPVSGQMANTVVFSALVDFLNRADRKNEQRRIRSVMNHHIIKGGHLSAQPMGALRDFVMRNPATERPAVVNFPVLADNPYNIDVEACAALIEQTKPELIILGKSMILHKEPVAELRNIIDSLGLDTLLMYDMAHVLGLTGPHFQEPFAEGADLVTGSTHKTFFGTQRGIVAADFREENQKHADLWEAIQRRAFPGAVSNHHLGTLLGLLLAAMEMNAFKDDYASKVVANAKAFARALKANGLDVAGDATVDFTQTHQVVVHVGYAKGPQIARRLEESNIICNYQASPADEGFTASGALRLGVAEMTRFGMQAQDFETVAGLMADVILKGACVREKAKALRQNFLDMGYCYGGDTFRDVLETLHSLV